MSTELRHQFADVCDWVFDLDNTLYPAGCNLFAEIDTRMTEYVSELLSCEWSEARKVQKDLYAKHGTTLAGLMRDHDVDPRAFMDYVHEIDLSKLSVQPGLREAIVALPGRKFVHTNGSVQHAANVLGALELADVIDDAFDVEMGGWVPKPYATNYEACANHFQLDPARSAMFEDMVVNLEVPHANGMRCVLVTTDAPWIEDEPEAKRPGAGHHGADHVHHITADLTEFLQSLTAS